jgi:soluble P-type ATPase
MSDNACSIKNNVLIMAKKAINCFNDTESISKHMVQALEERYGYSWICLIGSAGNDENLLKNADNSSILSLRIESLLITIFQIKHELEKNVN